MFYVIVLLVAIFAIIFYKRFRNPDWLNLRSLLLSEEIPSYVKHKRTAFILVFVSFLLLTGLYHFILNSNLLAQKERYYFIARNQAEHIITKVDCVMSRTNTLITMVKENHGDTSWFDQVAEDVYTSVTDETGVSLKNFAIAPHGVVSKVYPLEGNEALLGFDFLDTSREGNLEAKEAYEKGKTIITNPFKLIQGGTGMGGRAPVIFKNPDGTSLWGLVTVTIDFENLMDIINLENLHGMGVDYSLSYIDSDGIAQFMSGSRNLGKNTLKTQFNVRNLTWELEVKPVRGWLSLIDVLFSFLMIVTLSCFTGLIAFMMFRLREINASLLKMSTTDALTGCYNRRAYEDKIKELSSKPLEDDFVYVSGDLNGLKQTNDRYGHAAGDELISAATECLQKAFGPYGFLYRTGGDEFVALINADEETLAEILKNLHSYMENWRGKTVEHISVSIGYASHREFPDMTIEALSKAADKNMYKSKRDFYEAHNRRRSSENGL